MLLVRFNGEPSAELLKRLYDIPGTASIEFAGETQNALSEVLGFFWLFIGVMLIMGTALGLAIIFNGVTINVLERQRELAVMRAIGISGNRLSGILTLENVAIGCLGILVGIPLGYYIASYFLSLYKTDIFNMNLVIFPRTYVVAIILSLVSLLISQIPAIRRIRRLNLGTVTKGWAE